MKMVDAAEEEHVVGLEVMDYWVRVSSAVSSKGKRDNGEVNMNEKSVFITVLYYLGRTCFGFKKIDFILKKSRDFF